ncbi:MAG TPA: DUF3492 domain-containing protein [Balneolales bacterium]|nr:DUF3492 domain-containing protein [Balneolales bacterium]
MKKTILLIIEGTYPWYRGGVSEWVHQYLHAFSDCNILILQIASEPYVTLNIDQAIYEIPPNLIEFKRISLPDLANDWYYFRYPWSHTIIDTVKLFMRSVSLIHVTNTGFAGWLGTQLATYYKQPLLLTEHAVYWKEIEMGAVALECGYMLENAKYNRREVVSIFKQFAHETYLRAYKTISVSQHNLNYQRTLGANSPVYIPNGINHHLIDDQPADMTRNDMVIGWVGRCAKMKNPMRFFEVIETMHNYRLINVRFIMMLSFAGEAGLEDEINKQAKNYHYLEVIWNEKAINYIHKFDALCITSYNESQPLVLFEALSQNVLPFGWKAGDANAKYGLFIEQHEPATVLVNKLMTVWNNKVYWSEELQSKKKLLKAEHTWEKIFSKYRTLMSGN